MHADSEASRLEKAEDLRQLRESAEDFASRASPLVRARGLRGTALGYDRAFWDALVEQGWTGLLAPQECGGFAQGFAAAAVIVDALAMQLAPEPFVPAVVFAGRAIELSGGGPVHAELLQDLVGGKSIPVVAFEEQSIATAVDLTPRTVRAEKFSGGWRISGTKFNVRAAAGADGFVVSASLPTGSQSLFWVPVASAGVAVESRQTTDGGDSATLALDGVVVPDRHLLSQGSRAEEALTRAFDEALVMTSVELLAIQRAMFAMSLDYLRNRVQFGRPIGSFQTLQHRAVDLLIQKELTAAALGEIVERLDHEGAPRMRSRDASRAKARAAAAAVQIAKDSVQFHGAIGYTDEFDLGLYVQRTIVLSAWLGNAWMHRRRFAALDNVTEGAQA
ncbi:acyl-CoA dehydrogenase family protein [Variovorax defluvii]